MTEPVKLSRERWDALVDHWIRLDKDDRTIRSVATNRVAVTVPAEIDGVIFLPAEYVPDPARA